MYDVLYLDRTQRRDLVARNLDRATAVERARCEARRRHVGRMFMAGSEYPAACVVIVQSAR